MEKLESSVLGKGMEGDAVHAVLLWLRVPWMRLSSCATAGASLLPTEQAHRLLSPGDFTVNSVSFRARRKAYSDNRSFHLIFRRKLLFSQGFPGQRFAARH